MLNLILIIILQSDLLNSFINNTFILVRLKNFFLKIIKTLNYKIYLYDTKVFIIFNLY